MGWEKRYGKYSAQIHRGSPAESPNNKEFYRMKVWWHQSLVHAVDFTLDQTVKQILKESVVGTGEEPIIRAFLDEAMTYLRVEEVVEG